MERKDAERVFALVRDIDGDLRGRVIQERWWLVWITMGMQIAITASVTHRLLQLGEVRPERYAVLWGVHVALLPVIVAVIHRKRGGQRTATEQYLWWIWCSYLLSSLGVAATERATGQAMFAYAPMLAVLAAFAFSMLGMVTDPRFLGCSAYFVAVALAMAWRPGEQILIFGLAWSAVLVGLGSWLGLHRTPAASKRL